ncbi:alpha/beta fold hydrolase [Undibacterium sp. Jales W-56]|uniref:dienelactone hydrolase family protein n=1 Tax=Undibacterium sp. Jales W-56 TaxID=2897325 RepID=UPI0021D1F57A|nr:alpha/beta fold hydrolase [Undibacterium sp. Jales W-56]MCU6434832.1 alpha/beta fold hydrolase [Undibacterium sp. Jales W-56]
MKTIAFLFSAGLFSASGYADETLSVAMNESIVRIPTTVKTIFHTVVNKEMVVTQFKPAGEGRFPIAVILHGRSYRDRSKPERFRLLEASRYFLRRGFAVWVPTRLGYGDSGIEPDPEYTGSCSGKNYSPGYEAAAVSTLDVIEYAKKQNYVDPQRIVVVGQSYGGTTAISLAAKNIPGVIATVNFAGGGGGNPETQPEKPCRPDLLKELFGGYGKTARTPTLWIYTENDKYFGPVYPKQWFAEFQKQGGDAALGEYKALPAYGDNGHLFFSRGFQIWRPLVDEFLSRQGIAIPKSEGEYSISHFAKMEDVDSPPLNSQEAREKYAQFLKMDVPRAFAIGPKGEFGYASAIGAVQKALSICQNRANVPCQLYVVDDKMVWKRDE